MKKVAFYGVGTTGTQHINAFRQTQLYEIVCISSRSSEKTEPKAKKMGVPYARDIEEIYQRYEPSLIVICVPPNAVLEIMEKALQYPWEILVEKPAGITLDESKTLLDINNSRLEKNSVWVGMNRRMLPSTLLAKRELKKHRHIQTSPIQVRVTDQQDTASAQLFGHPEIVIRNWHFANSIHLVDLANSFLKHTPTVETVFKNKFEDGEIVAAKLKNDIGEMIQYEAYWNVPAPWSLEVITKAGWIQQSPIEQLRTLFERHEFYDLSQTEFSEPLDLKPGFYNQALALSDSNPALKSELCTLSESHESMVILDKIYEH